jgi:hypothetical protein
MNHKFSIYQVKESVIETEPMKAFAGHDEVIEMFGHGPCLDDYECLCSGSIEGDNTEEILEDLFYIFNCRHPEDFKGHSLSMGDIVELDSTMWYCDSFGWKQLETQKQ